MGNVRERDTGFGIENVREATARKRGKSHMAQSDALNSTCTATDTVKPIRPKFSIICNNLTQKVWQFS